MNAETRLQERQRKTEDKLAKYHQERILRKMDISLDEAKDLYQNRTEWHNRVDQGILKKHVILSNANFVLFLSVASVLKISTCSISGSKLMENKRTARHVICIARRRMS